MTRPHAATVLVFTLGPDADRSRRRLLAERCREAEVDLYRTCLDEAIRAGQAVGARILVCSPRPLALPAGVEHVPQSEGRFGERLAAAMNAAFERGTGPVVIVGSDSPDLTSGHLAQALAQITEDPERVVLGPSRDGGLYLLAAGRPIQELERGASWCRSDTLASLCASLAAWGRPVALLAPLIDLDRRSDLERWLAGFAPRGSWRRIVRRLRSVLAAERRPLVLWSLGRREPARTGVATGRAPPLFASS
jgi:hypothetical protein